MNKGGKEFMALRVRDDIVQLETVIGTNSTQTVADGHRFIPRQYAAGGADRKVTAVPNIKEHWVEEDRVNAEGTITGCHYLRRKGQHRRDILRKHLHC